MGPFRHNSEIGAVIDKCGECEVVGCLDLLWRIVGLVGVWVRE